jgi:hypothetical protein
MPHKNVGAYTCFISFFRMENCCLRKATIPGGKNVGASFLRQQFSILKKRELLPQEGRNHYHVETDRVNMTRWVALGVGPYPYG